MKLQGAIFDFDGVIVDTTPLHYHSWQRLLCDEYNTEFNNLIYEEKINGRRSSDVIPELLPHLSSAEHQAALSLKQDYYHALIAEGKLKIFNSTIQLIKSLIKNHIKIAVASSSRSVSYVLKKAKLLELFDVIISGHDTTRGKPHPESFLLAAQQLHLPVANCIVFEDAKAGIKAAKNGGFLCVAVTRDKELHNYQLADLCVTDLAEVNYEILTKLKGKS